MWQELLNTYKSKFEKLQTGAEIRALRDDFYHFRDVISEDYIDHCWEYIVGYRLKAPTKSGIC